MPGDNSAQSQNLINEGMGVLKDLSWLRRETDRPADVDSAGFQCQRFAQIDYDRDTEATKFDVDDENDVKAGIIEPYNWTWRTHEWNSKVDPVASPDKLQQHTDFTLAQQIVLGKGRRRPHSKNFAVEMIVDDKHVFESRLNRSTWVVRYSDYKQGDMDDLFQVREILFNPSGWADVDTDAYTTSLVNAGVASTTSRSIAEPINNGMGEVDQTNTYRLMDFLNTKMNREGGWIWRGPTPNLQQCQHVDKRLDVVQGYFGQKGDFWMLPAAVNYATTNEDTEQRSILSMRDDAHVCYEDDETYRGRIYFTKTDISTATEGSGSWVKGEMALDTSKANFDTDFKKETGEWRPVIRIPGMTYDVTGGVGGEPLIDWVSVPTSLQAANFIAADGNYGKGTGITPITFVIGADTYSFVSGLLVAVAGPA